MAATEQLLDTTPLQEAFVLHFVMNGGNGSDAVRRAGFVTKHPNSIAHQLLGKRHVQEAIRQEQFKQLNGNLASLALATLKSVMQDESAPAGARVTASVAVLERAGFSAQSGKDARQSKPVQDMTNEELAEFIRASKRVLEQHERQQAVVTVEGEAVKV